MENVIGFGIKSFLESDTITKQTIRRKHHIIDNYASNLGVNKIYNLYSKSSVKSIRVYTSWNVIIVFLMCEELRKGTHSTSLIDRKKINYHICRRVYIKSL